MGYLVICVAALKAVVAQNQCIIPGIPITVVANSKGGLIGGSCPSREELDTTIKGISNYSSSYIIQQMPQVPQCGDGLWYRVAQLNMSDPSQQCPSAWRKVAFGVIKACARANSILKAVALVFTTLLVVSTARCVEESLDINLEVHLLLNKVLSTG